MSKMKRVLAVGAVSCLLLLGGAVSPANAYGTGTYLG